MCVCLALYVWSTHRSPQSLLAVLSQNCCLSPFETLLEMHRHAVAGALADGRPEVAADGQLVGAIAKRHEGRLERLAIHRAAHLDEPAGAEELRRAGHHHVCPAPL